MNRMLRAVTCTGMGALTAFSFNFMNEAIAVNPAETNRQVERCAGVLGETAMQAEVLPAECNDLESSFDKIAVSIKHYIASSRTNSFTEEVEYVMPPAAEFRQSFIATEEDYQDYERQQRRGRIGSLIIGSVLGIATFSILTSEDRRRRRVQANKDSTTQAPSTSG